MIIIVPVIDFVENFYSGITPCIIIEDQNMHKFVRFHVDGPNTITGDYECPCY